MDTAKIFRVSKQVIETVVGTQKLFWLAPQIEQYCIDECFRLAQSETRYPSPPPGFDKAYRWQQICADVCITEFHQVMTRLRAERLAAQQTR